MSTQNKKNIPSVSLKEMLHLINVIYSSNDDYEKLIAKHRLEEFFKLILKE